MSLMRWFRKNNKKILAFLVIFLAVMFLIPTQLGRRRMRSRRNKFTGHMTIAGDTQKITAQDITQA